MGPSNIDYSSSANSSAGFPLSLSIFADRPGVRSDLRDDAEAAGFRIAVAEPLSGLLDGEAKALSEVILVDCPAPDAAALAALTRLDLRAAHAGSHLVVSTSVTALDEVFCCLDQSNPQILVDPNRADRVIALGRALARIPNIKVRELSEEDRLVLLRLTEQVSQIAQRLERLETPLRDAGIGGDSESSAFRFESPRSGFTKAQPDIADRLVRAVRSPLPDPRLVRRVIRQRQMRARFFDGDLFADPAWDMLLDLTAARAEHARVSVTSLCIASGVPPTTALRWIGQMIDTGLFCRVEDETDRRRAFITLTDKAADAMACYFAELGRQAARTI